MTFESLKHSLARDNALLHYLHKVIDEFQIPKSYVYGSTDDSPTTVTQTCVAGNLFRGLPTNKCMEKHELQEYHKRICKIEGKKRALTYVIETFAKRLRLNTEYPHDNLRQYSTKGVKMHLMRSFVEGKEKI